MSDTFQGFDEPTENWSKLPHSLIDNLHRITSESELKIILYVLRHTWGYHDSEKKITIDEFCNGRKRRDGSRIDKGSGMSENAIRAGIEKATEHGFIAVTEDATDKARIKRYYQLKGSNSDPQKLNPRPSKVEPQDSTSEPRSEKETNENKLKIGPLAQKLLSICRLNEERLTARQANKLKESLAILVNKINATPEQLEAFEKFWSDSWRTGPPNLLQVPECWGEFEEWQGQQPKTINGRIVHKVQ